MNGLDFVLLMLIVMGGVYGLFRGALRMVTSMAALGAGVFFGSAYASYVGGPIRRLFDTGPFLATVLGYALAFALAFAAVEIAGRVALGLVRVVHLGWLDVVGGAVVGGTMAAVLGGLLVMGLTLVLPSGSEMLRESELAPRVLVYTQGLWSMVPPALKDTYEAKREALTRYWMKRFAHPLPAPTASPTPSER